MNLRAIDLNLLVVFDAIYRERNISKAAQRLTLSQPAVSNALARLRERLGDPLFIRTTHTMVPTARANALVDPIQQALSLIEGSLRSGDAFDASRSERRFVIAVEDYGETVILSRFLDWLAQAAPGICIKIRPEPGTQLASEMKDGQVDLALDYFIQRDPSFHNECIMTDGLLSLSRVDHRQLNGHLSLEQYLKVHHIALSPRFGSMPMIDLALAKRGLRRHVSVELPHFQSMPLLVKNTELICTLPNRMAHLYAETFQLQTYEVPLRVPKFPIYLIWHCSMDADPAHTWLRHNLINFCRGL
jgi:DNA-binding transcriptional LysR family regulator